jgi:diacylglycerol kinase (ATP)
MNVNRVYYANPLLREDHPFFPIGLLPGGTGNSLLEDFGLTDIRNAAEGIARGRIRAIDANKVYLSSSDSKKYVYSINTICCGMIGDMAAASESIRWAGGIRYDCCGLWYALKGHTRPANIELSNGDTIKGRMMGAVINLNQHFGKKLRICPKAIWDDGKMDCVIVMEQPRSVYFQLFNLFQKGIHYGEKEIFYHQVQKIQFNQTEEGSLGIDGELYAYRGTISIECVPQAYYFMLPHPKR